MANTSTAADPGEQIVEEVKANQGVFFESTLHQKFVGLIPNAADQIRDLLDRGRIVHDATWHLTA